MVTLDFVTGLVMAFFYRRGLRFEQAQEFAKVLHDAAIKAQHSITNEKRWPKRHLALVYYFNSYVVPHLKLNPLVRPDPNIWRIWEIALDYNREAEILSSDVSMRSNAK